ncbi:hypothetical protein BDV98DRAFT_573907 [Pterulicium gracile]|uniref:Zn(2)-C6 fungal-type domain-containing protein n=1 Tax=Pterulicium gracile TaxID=1884261 RepID=A0A5C3QCF3_9AGAR|nr:hypothetical protein BDV98DRAFT_573907 [Pterula gracilis]
MPRDNTQPHGTRTPLACTRCRHLKVKCLVESYDTPCQKCTRDRANCCYQPVTYSPEPVQRSRPPRRASVGSRAGGSPSKPSSHTTASPNPGPLYTRLPLHHGAPELSWASQEYSSPLIVRNIADHRVGAPTRHLYPPLLSAFPFYPHSHAVANPIIHVSGFSDRPPSYAESYPSSMLLANGESVRNDSQYHERIPEWGDNGSQCWGCQSPICTCSRIGSWGKDSADAYEAKPTPSPFFMKIE